MIRKIRDEHWMSISDLMSGLMIVFMLIAIAYMVEVDHQHQKQNEVIEEYAIVKHNIYMELYNEFEGDLPKWNAELDEKTLAITFKEPDVLFATGSDVLTPQFKVILDDFLPRYIKVLSQEKYRDSVEEIRIEGHTDPNWKGANSRQEEYEKNMNLSQLRTQTVLKYAIEMPSLQKDLEWMIAHITANGLSSSHPVISSGVVDNERSRRVEFRVRTNADEKLNNLQEGLK